MEADPRIVVLGEDVHRLNGGTNGATKGLAKKYGPEPRARHPDQRERLLRTRRRARARRPLPARSSSSCIPTSCGSPPTRCSTRSARRATCSAATTRVPLVLRTKVAMGSGYGSQHLMDPAGIFATAPGWRIVAPSTAADYVGLMNAALALQDPVLVIEHVDLYGTADRVPEGDLDYIMPPGTAAIRREGSDVTVISYLSMVHARARGDRADRHRRRADRPALARSRLDRLGHHRRVASRRPTRCSSSSRARAAPRTAAGWPTRSSAASSTGSTSRSSA